VLNVTTVDFYSYTQTWISTEYRDHIVLMMKGCKDAHILLSDAVGLGTNMYEVALGINGNTQSVMREGPYGPNVVWIETPSILHCQDTGSHQ